MYAAPAVKGLTWWHRHLQVAYNYTDAYVYRIVHFCLLEVVHLNFWPFLFSIFSSYTKTVKHNYLIKNKTIFFVNSPGILTTGEGITATLKVISATLSHYKVILATEEVATVNLKVISATTKSILDINKLVSAREKVI